jgi:hypothetical protein
MKLLVSDATLSVPLLELLEVLEVPDVLLVDLAFMVVISWSMVDVEDPVVETVVMEWLPYGLLAEG